jgi:hypothetical protein
MKIGFNIALLVLACLLAACGGGGSAGGSAQAGNNIALDRESVILVQSSPQTTFGAPPGTGDVTATFRGAGVVVSTLPGEMLPQWLKISAPSTSSSPVKFALEGSAANAGKFQTTLRFFTGNADQTGIVSRDLPVTFLILPKVVSEVVVPGVAQGSTVRTSIAIDAGNASFALGSDVAWMKFDQTSVTGNTNISFTVDPAALAVGIHTAKMTLEETVTKTRKIVSVSFRVDSPQLLVRQRGVALSLVGNEARLQSTITIGDNGKAGLQWSAQADKPWLKLSQQSGTTHGSLTVTAEPAGLQDGMHYATVTLQQEGTLAAAPLSVRVGVYLDRTLPFSTVAKVTASTSRIFGVVADPIRPYFYHLELEGQLRIYNMYSGTLEGTIQFPSPIANAMTIAHDGSRLFVLDYATRSVYPVNLDTRVVEAPIVISSDSLSSSMRIEYAELSRLPVLVTNLMSVIDLRTGTTLANQKLERSEFPSLVVQRDGRAVFAQTGTGGNHYLSRVALSNFQGSVSFGEPHEKLQRSSSGAGLALDPTDMYLYAAVSRSGVATDTGDAYRFSTSDMSLTGVFPNAKGDTTGVATTAGGIVLLSQWSGSLNTFGADFSGLGSGKYGEHIDDVTISGDGRRAALYVQEAGMRVIYFVAVP